jgi:XisI protein
MDRLATYRAAIKKILGDFAAAVNRDKIAKDLDLVCIFDDAQGLYMVYSIGWDKHDRISIPTLFIRIIEGKIWVEENWTEIELGEELMELGVAKEDICVGWVPPFMRDPEESVVA